MDQSRDVAPGAVQQQLQEVLSTGYTIDRELGGGGMSRVFVAHEVALGREVVVKVLPPDMAASVSIDRFRREVQVAAKLQHPHIVPVLTAGASASLLYYTMPLVDGESLRHRLDRGVAFGSSEALRTWRDVIDALAYAHAHGVVHRDIKPDNILLSSRHALVTDFGIARAVEAATTNETRMTATGLSIGTPAYMSPEQAAGDHDVDGRADIYSAGLVMYEMLSGGGPFMAGSMREIAVAHLTKEPAPLVPRDPACPRALVALVMRCLAKDPAHRPQSAEAILAELDALITPSAQPAVAIAASKRRRTRVIGAITVMILALAVSAWGAKTRRLPFMTPLKPADDSLRLIVFIAENKYDAADSTLAGGYADAIAASVSKDPWVFVADTKGLAQFAMMQGFPITSMTRDTIIYIAKRGRTNAYLSLAMSRAGSGYVLSAEPRGARDDNSLGVIQEAANSASELPAAIQRVGAKLRTLLVKSRESLPFTQSAFVLDDIKPRAIKFHMEARIEFDKRNYVEAANLERLAVKEDSTFSEAWSSLGYALSNAGIARSERLAARSNAYRMRASIRSPLARQQVAADYFGAIGQLDSAIAAYDLLIKMMPNSERVGVNNQGLLFASLRKYGLAEESYRKSIDTSYKSTSVTNSNLVSVLLHQGKIDDARAEVARLERADSANGNTRQAKYVLATALRTWDVYEALGKTWMAVPSQSAQLRGLLYLRGVAAVRGQLAQFNTLSKKRGDLLGGIEPANFIAEFLVRARTAVNLEGDPAHARAIIDSMLSAVSWQKLDALDRPYSSIITALAQAGDVKRAQSYAEEWSRVRPPEFRMIDSLSVLEARGEIALASGNAREALRLFRLSDVQGCIECSYPKYARAYDVLKIPDSSLVWYEKYAVATIPANPMGDAYDLARTYRRLGELYEDRRETIKAISSYGQMVTLWEHADAMLQPTVSDVKARIARLQAKSR